MSRRSQHGRKTWNPWKQKLTDPPKEACQFCTHHRSCFNPRLIQATWKLYTPQGFSSRALASCANSIYLESRSSDVSPRRDFGRSRSEGTQNRGIHDSGTPQHYRAFLYESQLPHSHDGRRPSPESVPQKLTLYGSRTMSTKRISFGQLASFCTSSECERSRIARQVKHVPAESRIRIPYYVQAKSVIRHYHRDGHPVSWLALQAGRLASDARPAMSSQRAVRLLNNAEAVMAYANAFAGREFTILAQARLRWCFSDVVVTVGPDMHVVEAGRERFVRVEATPSTSDGCALMASLMWLAVEGASDDLAPDCCRILALRTKQEFVGEEPSPELVTTVENACHEFSELYDRL